MRLRTLTLSACPVLLAALALAGEPLAKHQLTLADGKTLTLAKESETKWTVTEGDAVHALVLGDKQAFTFHKGDAALATGKRKGSKLRLRAPDDKLYLVVKFKEAKVKFALTEDEDGWEVKTKKDKASLKKGDKELAKVKHYADSGKLKVKDADGDTVVESRDFKKLCAAPLGLAVPGLDADRRKLVVLILLATQQ